MPWEIGLLDIKARYTSRVPMILNGSRKEEKEEKEKKETVKAKPEEKEKQGKREKGTGTDRYAYRQKHRQTEQRIQSIYMREVVIGKTHKQKETKVRKPPRFPSPKGCDP